MLENALRKTSGKINPDTAKKRKSMGVHQTRLIPHL